MTATEHFDLYTEYKPVTVPLLAAPAGSPLSYQAKTASLQRDANLVLDTVMFTGRVPLSTWTFSIALDGKLWVSDRISLFFGKETPIRRFIYQESLPVEQHRVDLEIGIAAYNNYGDVLNATRKVRFYDAGNNVQPSALFQLEDNWMQLLFKFRLSLLDSVQG